MLAVAPKVENFTGLTAEKIKTETEKIQAFIESFKTIDQIDEAVDVLYNALEKEFLFKSEFAKLKEKLNAKLKDIEVFTVEQLKKLKNVESALRAIEIELTLLASTVNRLEIEIIRKIPKPKEEMWINTGRYLIKVEDEYITEIKTV